MKNSVMFVCVEDAGRSQMAEAFAKKYAGDKIKVVSAGTLPAKPVHPEVSIVLKEKGTDIPKNTPKYLMPKWLKRPRCNHSDELWC